MNTEEKTHTRLTPVFIAMVIIFGLTFVWVWGRIIERHRMQQTWRPVTARVVRVDPNGWWDEEARQRYYLEYGYVAGGKSYTGTRYHTGERSLKTYEDIEYRYKKGDPVTVYYDPRHPDQAALSLSYLRDEFVFATVLAGFLVLGATGLLKENREKTLAAAVAGLGSDSPMPGMSGVREHRGLLQLDTGMSVFWRVGMPFILVCFAGITPGLFLLGEINPDWHMADYLAGVFGIWTAGAAAGFLMTRCFSFVLAVDTVKREIREDTRFCLGVKTVSYPFDRVSEIRLYREKWRQDNPLRNWIMFIQTTSGRSVTVSRGFRDFQPAHKAYLEIVKERIEKLVSDR